MDDDGAQRLKNWEYIGQCYDILTVDPVNLNAGRPGPTVFSFEDFENVPDGTASKPTGTAYQVDPGGAYTHRVLELSSLYDYKTSIAQEGSLNVGDPTGELYSASLSASYTRTRDDTEKNESIVTYTGEKVTLWQLMVRTDARAPSLTDDMAAALAALPTTVTSGSHDAFFKQFGTHYAQRVVFGGLLTQRISVSRRDYESFLEEGVNVAADVKATFDICKAGAKGDVKDTRSETFKNARSLTVEDIMYVGGTAPQSLFDMWAITVKDAPGPVTADFEPHYKLLTAERFPDDPQVVQRRAALQQATESYLASNGSDSSRQAIQSGDTVSLTAIIPGKTPCLMASARAVCASLRGDLQKSEVQWLLVSAEHPEAGGVLDMGSPVALRSVACGAWLDAQSGSDEIYSVGEGLAGVSAAGTVATSVQWIAQLARPRGRSRLVNGDYVQLLRRWIDEEGRAGYLCCDAEAGALDQRVFSFGHSGQKGSVWRLDRVAASPGG